MTALLIKNGTLCNPDGKEPFVTDILVKDGKFAKIAQDIPAEKSYTVIDAAGKFIYPGMVDAHCHTGLSDFAISHHDYNEYCDPVTPQLRAIDAFNPIDETVRRTALGGVTAFATGPGSSNVLGGIFMVVKPLPNCRIVDEMVIEPALAMKAAFGENPRRCYAGKGISSRMTTASMLREYLFKAKEYDAKVKKAEAEQKDLPAFDMKLEALRPVVRGEMTLKVHAHQANDIMTAVRIGKEFGLKLTLDHCTEGHLIAEDLAKLNFPVAIGPTMHSAKKIELREKSFVTPGILAKAGCLVSIITDADVMEQRYLPLMAAEAINAGMEPLEAFKAVTINPAKMLGLDDRIGSIEEGKDADFLITCGDPIADFSRNVIERVFINGVEYDK